VFDPETTAFLESGCALIVGAVGPGGEPHATRGWGLTIEDRAAGRVRLLLDPADATGIEYLHATGAIAITAADVPTLRSMQIKGRVVNIEAAADADRDRAAQYCDEFFGDIVAVDGVPRELPDRLVPSNVVVCTVEADDFFNQTPGPTAGTPITGAAP
jgi:hypothetical protein